MTPRQRIDTYLLGLGLVLSTATARATPILERVSDQACRALALDREPYVAALGDDAVTVFDKRGSHREPLPAALRGASVSLGVFFGRDYRVRVAGTAHTPQGDEVRYYRSLAAGLTPALDELGPLGKRGGPGLVALLGTVDPEIVCRPGQSCLLKRVSGWQKASSPAGLTRVGLSLGAGWAVAGQQLYRLGSDWEPVAAPGTWQSADDAFVRSGEACVVEHDASRLHHFDGHAWHSSPAPINGPRSLWGSEDALWLGGDGGAAYYEAGAFRVLPGTTQVRQILGRSSDDVWLCTDEGVFRVRRPQTQPGPTNQRG
jgi:hypothetical protein